MAFCTNCGAKIEETVKFCPGCGTQVLPAGAELRQEQAGAPVQAQPAPVPVSPEVPAAANVPKFAMTGDTIAIPLNKGLLQALLVVGIPCIIIFGIAFVSTLSLFIDLINSPDDPQLAWQYQFDKMKWYFTHVEIFLLVFFLMMGFTFSAVLVIYVVRKLSSTNPGLVIDNTGILDNAGFIAAGQILWEHITEIKPVAEKNLLLVVVKNPDDFIDLQKFSYFRQIVGKRYRKHGSPIGITPWFLKGCTYTDLKNIVQEQFNKRKIAT